MPAQWKNHLCTVMAWPFHDHDEWMVPISEVHTQFRKLLQGIATVEEVLLLCRPQDIQTIPDVISSDNAITIIPVYLNDVWTRDFAPIFLKNGQVRLPVIWEFTGYGNKFASDGDSNAWRCITEHLNSPQIVRAPLKLEGGAVEVDGNGYGITTRSCVLNPSRNPNVTEEEVATIIKTYFGLHSLTILDDGFVGNDHTDGHIDMVARFSPVGNIVANWIEDSQHPSFKSFSKNFEALTSLSKQRGGRTVKLPIPESPIVGPNWGGGTIEAPANYSNFYATHSHLFVPQFNDRSDQSALTILKESFPDHQVIGILATELVRGGGGIFNCLTQQVPL
jgi:agmatine deiminase